MTDTTTTMNQVLCSLCNMKTDVLKFIEHLVSTIHLELVVSMRKIKLQQTFSK